MNLNMDTSTTVDDAVEKDFTENVVCPAIPTVIFNDEPLSPRTIFYSKEERLNYSAQYNHIKRGRRRDSGYSGASRISTSERLYENEMSLVQKSLETGSLHQKDIAFEYTTKVRHSQRPQYPNDGSQGYIKCEDGSAVIVTTDVCLHRLQGTDQKAVFALKVGLTDATGLPAKHFEVYNTKLGTCSNLFEIDDNVFIFGDLEEGKNNISLERIGIRRKEKKGRTMKLEKECWLTSTLYLVDMKANRVFFCGQIVSDQIKCEQEIGPPALLHMEPKQSSSEGGGVLAVKGKNFIPGITKVIFKGTKECECQLAEGMASKEMVVCYIPNSQNVGGEVVDVFVRTEEKRSAALKFQYIWPQTVFRKQKSDIFTNCLIRQLEGNFGGSQDSCLSELEFTSIDENGNLVVPEDQIFSFNVANEGEVEDQMEYDDQVLFDMI